jgi:hypothetical protein
MWKEILLAEHGSSSVVIDSQDASIAAFGIYLLVSNEIADRLRHEPQPLIRRKIFDDWTQGKAPFLSKLEIGISNAGEGVNVLILHDGYRKLDDKIEHEELRLSLARGFIDRHLGIRIRTFIHEKFTHDVYSREDREAARRMGLNCIEYPSDYPDLQVFPLTSRPFLMTLSHEEAMEQRGNYLTDLLVSSRSDPPRFLFNSKQRELLKIAFECETDEGMADRLSISVAAVNDRWKSIYRRIADLDPFILGKAYMLREGRGPTLRHKVLFYIRAHPEELHPYVPSSKPASKGARGKQPITQNLRGTYSSFEVPQGVLPPF